MKRVKEEQVEMEEEYKGVTVSTVYIYSHLVRCIAFSVRVYCSEYSDFKVYRTDK